jgi:hypothetical protein
MISPQNITRATTAEKTPLRRLLFTSLFAFCILHFAFPSPAQLPPQTENRFLFIINTSAAMRPMSNGIRDSVTGLLQSRMQDQMRDGDSFGIWTYDAQLHADFPMQIWSNDKQAAILQVVTNWLAERRYQNKPHLEKVLPAARQIAAMSRVVTLIFIYDGTEPMQNVAFENDINALQKETGRRMLADHIPFVTVLAARDGKFFDYRVRTPASVSLPLTAQFFPARTNAVAVATNPPPPAVAVSNATPPVVAAKPPEPRRLEIVLKPSAPPATNPPPPALSVPVAQNAPETPPPPIQPASSAVSSNTLPVVTAPPLAQPLPAPTPPPANVAAAAPPPAEVPRQSTAAPAPSNPPISSAPNPNLNPNPPIVSAQPPPAHPDAQQALTAPAPPGRTAPPAEAAAPPAAANPSTAAAPSSAPLPAPAAVAIPSASDHVALLLIAISLVVIAAVLVVFLIRRSRTPPSLISQSMNRPR